MEIKVPKFKLLKSILLVLISLIVLLTVHFECRPQSIPILAYHDFDYQINLKEDDEWTDSVENFESQMKYIHDNSYTTISMEEFYCWKKGKCTLPKKSVLITFDDGNKSIYNFVYPIMKKYGLKGTSFIIGDR